MIGAADPRRVLLESRTVTREERQPGPVRPWLRLAEAVRLEMFARDPGSAPVWLQLPRRPFGANRARISTSSFISKRCAT